MNSVVKKLADSIKEKGRLIDYFLIQNLFEDKKLEIMKELKNYLNEDGGFGHGLEPDTMLPFSSVLCTDEAVLILEEINDIKIKNDLISKVVNYYESVYNDKSESWELVPKEVDAYPRAVWWNYEGVNDFTYGNPNPQIIGFMYKYKDSITNFYIDYHVNKVVDYINNQLLKEASKHNILSCLIFYKFVSEDIKSKIYNNLQIAIDNELEKYDKTNYCLEPYEVLLMDKAFLRNHKPLLKKNLDLYIKKINEGLIYPNWSWGQYLDIFENQKIKWAGHLTFKVIKALLIENLV